MLRVVQVCICRGRWRVDVLMSLLHLFSAFPLDRHIPLRSMLLAQFRRRGYAFHMVNGHAVAYLDPEEFLSADRSARVCLHVRVRAYERNTELVGTLRS